MTTIDTVDTSVLFEKALHAWTTLDLPRLQRELDDKVVDIRESQNESLLDRKKLATKTKEFKKLEDEEKIGEINPLLKLYQNQIDSLNKKNKNVESLLFKIYKLIADAPDPKTLLKIGMNSIVEAQKMDDIIREKQLLEEKLMKYADYDQIKTQLFNSQKKMDDLMELQLKAKDNEWSSILDEKEKNWNKNEFELNEKLEKLNTKIVELETNEKMLKLKLKKRSNVFEDEDDEDDRREEEPEDEREEDEIYEKERNAGGEIGGKSGVNKDIKHGKSISKLQDVSSKMSDLENSKKRIKALEARNEELRRELSTSNSKIEIEIEKAKQEQQQTISNLESENVLLIAKLENERQISSKLREDISKVKAEFDHETNLLNDQIDELKQFKDKCFDYDEIKKELELLKQIQFDDSTEETSSIDKIESAIVQRNKKLNAQIVELKQQNEKSIHQVDSLNEKIKEFEATIEQLKDANQRLENDLIDFDHSTSHNDDKWDTMSMISSVAGHTNGRVSPSGSITGTIVNTSSNDSTLLPIITQQRDRFRNRNKELEDENKKHFNKIIELKREINTLKNDNRQLYEKIRFLQFHQSKTNMEQNHGIDIENKYKSDYEHELHPIEQFRLMETRRINSKITPWDRIFIQVTRTILSTPYTRWLFVAYCCGLHLLVMVMSLTLMSGPSNIVEVSSSPLTADLSGNLDHDMKIL
ncbi:unnamed protein product [Pichia kudriavzevii]